MSKRNFDPHAATSLKGTITDISLNKKGYPVLSVASRGHTFKALLGNYSKAPEPLNQMLQREVQITGSAGWARDIDIFARVVTLSPVQLQLV